MRSTIKTICCSLCISIPMLSLSIFPSLPFRAVEVLSCDITLHRGKLESPARCFTPLVSSQRICFGHKCSFTTCISPLSCMSNMAFQQLNIQWLSAESEFELIASVFGIFSAPIFICRHFKLHLLVNASVQFLLTSERTQFAC